MEAMVQALASTSVDLLVDRHRRGFGLVQEFSTDPNVYRLDVERIWRRSWLFACHSAEVAQPGDFVVVDIDDDSVIVVRGAAGEMHALHNLCRHRGTRLCAPPGGHANRLVCPYHQWSYGLDGSLEACGSMDETGEVDDRSSYGLFPVAVEEVAGLVFVHLAAAAESDENRGGDPPADFAQLRSVWSSVLETQGLTHAKVAASRGYDVRANWKLVWENNRECWHCAANHPEYGRANPADLRGLFPFPGPGRGLGPGSASAGGAGAGGAGAGGAGAGGAGAAWWSVNRAPLADGWRSESVDGALVAPTMGSRSAADGDTIRLRSLPNFWNHSSCDHSVSTRLLPAGPGVTRIRVTWLVDADAVEGRDYRIERLLPLWELTSEQDWALCERNQAGIRSPAFVPGPYSQRREANVLAFIDWYLDRLSAP
jgi:Rieske 2Fe-2S family protein